MKKLGLYLLIIVLFYAFYVGIPILGDKIEDAIDERKMNTKVIYDVKEECGKTIIILGKAGYSVENAEAA